jgi:hypothetical protein
MLVVLSGLGTGEPQTEQKSERNPLGLCHDETFSSPESQRNCRLETSEARLEAVPLCRLQSEQWQRYSLSDFTSTSNETVPHRHSPRMVGSSGEV